MSLIVFFMFQIYDKNIKKHSKDTDNEIVIDSNTTKINNFFPNNKENHTIEKIMLLQNDAFASMTLIAIYLSILIIANNIAISKKSPLYFSLFFIMSVLITINFLTNILDSLPLLKNFKDPLRTNNDIISKTFNIFQYIFSGLNFVFIIYFVYIYFAQIGYFKYNLEGLSFEKIYEEIALRTDMMKISFNYWIISLKLNKMFPGLLYRKKDYYFNKMTKKDEIEDFEDELNDKVDSLTSKPVHNSTTYSNCKRNSGNYSYDAIHSKSTIDCEYESLK